MCVNVTTFDSAVCFVLGPQLAMCSSALHLVSPSTTTCLPPLQMVLMRRWIGLGMKSLSCFPFSISMSLPICSSSPCCFLTCCSSVALINPPAAFCNLSLSPVLINTLSLRSPCRETSAAIFHGLMGQSVEKTRAQGVK